MVRAGEGWGRLGGKLGCKYRQDPQRNPQRNDLINATYSKTRNGPGSSADFGTRIVYLTSFVVESRVSVTAATIVGLSGTLPYEAERTWVKVRVSFKVRIGIRVRVKVGVIKVRIRVRLPAASRLARSRHRAHLRVDVSRGFEELDDFSHAWNLDGSRWGQMGPDMGR